MSPLAPMLLAAFGLAAVSEGAFAQQQAPELARIVATIEGVDAVRRTLLLRGPKGEVVTMGLGGEVHNLPRLKAGERVAVTYAQAMVVALRKYRPGDASVVPLGAAHAAPSGRLADGAGREIKLVGDVALVNLHKQTVTLRGPAQRITLKLRDAAQLSDVTAGDRVEATYTEALAVAVEAAPGSPGGH